MTLFICVESSHKLLPNSSFILINCRYNHRARLNNWHFSNQSGLVNIVRVMVNCNNSNSQSDLETIMNALTSIEIPHHYSG